MFAQEDSRSCDSNLFAPSALAIPPKAITLLRDHDMRCPVARRTAPGPWLLFLACCPPRRRLRRRRR